MPEKDPNLWTYIVVFFRDLVSALTSSHIWLGTIMAAVMAMFRNLYDENRKSIKIQFAECVICGCLTLSVATILDYFSIPSSASICVGGAIGFLGVEKIRKFMDDFINRKVKSNREKDTDDDV